MVGLFQRFSKQLTPLRYSIFTGSRTDPNAIPGLIMPCSYVVPVLIRVQKPLIISHTTTHFLQTKRLPLLHCYFRVLMSQIPQSHHPLHLHLGPTIPSTQVWVYHSHSLCINKTYRYKWKNSACKLDFEVIEIYTVIFPI